MPDALLLGNGFSRAYDDEVFNYDALREAAGLPDRLDEIFTELETTDFELVMRRLSEALDLLPHYDVPADCRREMRRDIDLVRRSLVTALQEHHPEGAHELPAAACRRCADFVGGYSTIFTLNYDLLLYWVIAEHLRDVHSDGFGGRPLQWQGPRADAQTVYYLHGALHLYDTGTTVRKLRSGGGNRLLAQLRTNMGDGEFPLFVSEGDWRQKLSRIRSNPYLLDAYDHLRDNALPLTILGFNFSPQDRHVTDALADSKTPKITAVLYSDASRAEKNRVRIAAQGLADRIELPRGNVELAFAESNDFRLWR